MAKKISKAQLRAWREARVENYARTRSVRALAGMVVELEDDHGGPPEFEYDEAWPAAVQHLRIK
jgi:hypothetical protein